MSAGNVATKLTLGKRKRWDAFVFTLFEMLQAVNERCAITSEINYKDLKRKII